MADSAEFSWPDPVAVVIKRIDAIAVYSNTKNDIVIRQEGPLGDDDSIIVVPRPQVSQLIAALKRENGQQQETGEHEVRQNPSIPELPEVLPSLDDAIGHLFEPAIPDPAEFLADGWWKNAPDETDSQVRMLWFRCRQTRWRWRRHAGAY